MATTSRKTTNRETVRDDPPEVEMSLTDNMFQIIRADGRPLINGNRDERFQYCWVTKRNLNQTTRYQGHGYRPCRLGPDEVRPRFEMWVQDEDRDEGSNPLIERADMFLMKRPIKWWQAEQDARVDKRRAQQARLAGVNAGDASAARSASARVEVGDRHSIGAV